LELKTQQFSCDTFMSKSNLLHSSDSCYSIQ